MTPPRLLFVVESGTDVRLVDGLARHFALRVLARRIDGGVEISHPPDAPIEVSVGPASRFAFARRALGHLRRHRRDVDVVLAQGYGVGALVANLARRLWGIPTAMLVCSPVELYYRCRAVNPVAGKPYRRRELAALEIVARLNARLGARYIVLSRHLRDVVLRHGTRRPIDVVPVYGVDSTVFRPPLRDKRSIRADAGLPDRGALIFFGSRIAPEKDAITLIDAFKKLLDAGRDVWLLHRSGGYREFSEAARSGGIDHRIIAMDAVHPLHDLPRDYHASDVFIQASREEGLGFAPLEALACETPVVAAQTGGLRETIKDGTTGWTYPVGNVTALAAQIEDVLDRPDEAARRAAAGRAMVVADYERDGVFRSLAAILGTV
ncbi:MAG: glycosyltransferase family 4 protein [Gemmatimonadetes bacterium]|nr:glycosyltransferase family 4 protein [Gemmatimonadota bacterium]